MKYKWFKRTLNKSDQFQDLRYHGRPSTGVFVIVLPFKSERTVATSYVYVCFHNGIKQGGSLSNLLFNIGLKTIISKIIINPLMIFC